MKNYQITISRYNGCDEVCKEDWKNLISSLVLAGYEIYGDNEIIVFTLGHDDKIKIIEEE